MIEPIAYQELVIRDVVSTPTSFSIGPPVCKFCGKVAWPLLNGPDHDCPGKAAYLHARKVADAVRLLEGDGYTVTPPGSTRP